MTATLPRAKRLWSQKLSTAAQVPADHGQVAVIEGLASCAVYTHDGATASVSCHVIEVDRENPGDIRWQNRITLGVPAAGETCENPWVARLSASEFVATWERTDTTTGATTIEAARIYKSGESWAADLDNSSGSGIGYALDATVSTDVTVAQALRSGACCRTVWVEDGYFAVAYNTETANAGTAPHERTYERRREIFSWLVAGAPVSAATRNVTADVHWDDADASPTSTGGFARGHMVVTSRGDILDVWANRDWNGANFVNTLRFALRAGLYAATPLTGLQNGTLLSVTDDDLAYRRPHLAGLHPKLYSGIETDPLTGAEVIYLAFHEEDVDTFTNTAARLLKVSLYGGAAPTVEEIAWKGNFGFSGTKAAQRGTCALNGRLLKGGIAANTLDANGGIALSCQEPGGHSFVETSVRWPDRPDAAIVPHDGKEYLFVSYEGSEDGGINNDDRWLDLYELGAI